MSTSSPHILVVEDEPQIRRLICEALRGEGYTCGESPNARDALALAAGNDVALVLLDLGLPGMSGNEFIQELRTW